MEVCISLSLYNQSYLCLSLVTLLLSQLHLSLHVESYMFVDSVFRYHILLVHFLCLSYAFLLNIHLQENKRKAMQINVCELQGLTLKKEPILLVF